MIPLNDVCTHQHSFEFNSLALDNSCMHYVMLACCKQCGHVEEVYRVEPTQAERDKAE